MKITDFCTQIARKVRFHARIGPNKADFGLKSMDSAFEFVLYGHFVSRDGLFSKMEPRRPAVETLLKGQQPKDSDNTRDEWLAVKDAWTVWERAMTEK